MKLLYLTSQAACLSIVLGLILNENNTVFSGVDSILETASVHSHSKVQQHMTDIVNSIVGDILMEVDIYTSMFKVIDDAEIAQRELLQLVKENIKNDMYKEAMENLQAANSLGEKVDTLKRTPLYLIPAAQLEYESNTISPVCSDELSGSKDLSCAWPKTRLIKDIEEVLQQRESQDDAHVEVECEIARTVAYHIDQDILPQIIALEEKVTPIVKLMKGAESDAKDLAMKKNFDSARKKKALMEQHRSLATSYDKESLVLQVEYLIQKRKLDDIQISLRETMYYHELAMIEIRRLEDAFDIAVESLELDRAEHFVKLGDVYRNLVLRLENTALYKFTKREKDAKDELDKVAIDQKEALHRILIRTDADIYSAVNLWCSNRQEALNKYGHINDWNTSSVTNMKSLFGGILWSMCSEFNDDISRWDTSRVSNMRAMFAYAKTFNGNISGWNTSNVSSMNAMFLYAEAFNRDIGDWNTSKVTDMWGMFFFAKAFNRDLSRWDVSKVSWYWFMFSNCPKTATFNKPRKLLISRYQLFLGLVLCFGFGFFITFLTTIFCGRDFGANVGVITVIFGFMLVFFISNNPNYSICEAKNWWMF